MELLHPHTYKYFFLTGACFSVVSFTMLMLWFTDAKFPPPKESEPQSDTPLLHIEEN